MLKTFRKEVSVFIVLILLLLTACQGWTVEQATIAPLATLTPSVQPTNTLPNPPTLTPTLTLTPTITLTPRFSPTPPLGATEELSEDATSEPVVGLGGERAPEITYFIADLNDVQPGESVILFWSAEYAVSAALTRLKPDGTPGRTWAVNPQGSLIVTPSGAGVDEIYVLSVTNGVTTIERRVTITVDCESIWFFEPAPTQGCPQDTPQTMFAIIQLFERGKMIWFGETRRIIVMFEDSPDNISEKNPAWIEVEDTYTDEEPEIDTNLEVPEGVSQPVRGFGKVWRETENVSARLGWATSGEMSYEIVFQYVVIGDSGIHLFLSDREGAIYDLGPDGSSWGLIGQFTGIAEPTPEEQSQ